MEESLASEAPFPPLAGGSRVFLPLSIGNHYYSNQRLRRISNEIVGQSAYTVIFICDELRRLSYYVKGITDESIVAAKVALQLLQTKQTLHNCGLTKHQNLDIWSWSNLPDQGLVFSIYKRIHALIADDQYVIHEADRHIEATVSAKNDAVSSRGQATHYQLQYFALETALSIYMNEVMCFDYEVYRRSMGIIDYIYATQAGFVKTISNGITRRTVISLEKLWSET
jgi:hypothetical protein